MKTPNLLLITLQAKGERPQEHVSLSPTGECTYLSKITGSVSNCLNPGFPILLFIA